VEVADVLMVERGNRPRLAVESLTRLRVIEAIRGQHLYGNRTIEARVAGAIDLAHTAGADFIENLVRAESRTTSHCHRRRPL
jgi:hypothetical protein